MRLFRINRDPVSTVLAIVGAASGAGSIISSRNQKKAAESAAEAQKDIAAKQLAATQAAEGEARKTAEAQRRAALARKDKTILTSPLGVELDAEQSNQNTILGVPQ